MVKRKKTIRKIKLKFVFFSFCAEQEQKVFLFHTWLISFFRNTLFCYTGKIKTFHVFGKKILEKIAVFHFHLKIIKINGYYLNQKSFSLIESCLSYPTYSYFNEFFIVDSFLDSWKTFITPPELFCLTK
jgi:hypothetical protein